MIKSAFRSFVLGTVLASLSIAHGAVVVVEMRNNFFLPDEVTINVGDTVTWVQRGSNHDTVSYEGVWASELLRLNQTFSFTFNNPGDFSYYCTPHEQIGMVGTVHVQGGGNNPLTVSVTAPSTGATFLTTDTITFSATASDDGSVAKVEFFAGATLIGADTSAPFSITGTLSAGTHSITAKATDNAGTTTTSSAVTVTVSAPNQPPAVSLTVPANGATFLSTDTITFSATASDDGTIAKVEFFTGGNLIGTDTTAPYSITGSLGAGSHSITAKATDNAGATTTSSVVTITVNGPTNQLPTVSLTSQPGVLAAPANIILQANASDADGSIAQVEFFNGTTSVGVDTTAPYEISQSNLTVGVYTFTAVARDNAGAQSTSSEVLVSVATQPRISSVTHNNATWTLNVEGTTGVPHTLETTVDFTTWSAIATNTPVAGATIFSDSSNGPRKVYRVTIR